MRWTYHCPDCDSMDVFHDAYVNAHDPGDVRVFDSGFCEPCGKAVKTLVRKNQGWHNLPDDELLHMLRTADKTFAYLIIEELSMRDDARAHEVDLRLSEVVDR